MGTVTHTLEVAAPAERVFRVATRIADLPRWLPEVVGAELLDEPLDTGSRVRLTLGAATGNAVLTGTVTELTWPSTLAMTAAGGPLTVSVRTWLEPLAPDRTRISLELDLGAPPFLGFIVKEAERRIVAELPAALERFRALLDAEPI
jgi:uncharacterized protein YndB with AHSA1/START domain